MKTQNLLSWFIEKMLLILFGDIEKYSKHSFDSSYNDDSEIGSQIFEQKMKRKDSINYHFFNSDQLDDKSDFYKYQ